MAYQSMTARAAGYIVKAATDWNVMVSNFAALWVGTTAGDMEYYTNATTKTRLAIGTAGQILTVSGTVPTWGAGFPSGVILDYGGTAAPTGYLACDGAAVSRTTYAALFTAIGTVWGAGNGSTTFNLPSLARYTTVGSGGTATATLGNTVGSKGGEEAHANTAFENAPHTHEYSQTLSVSHDDTTSTGTLYNVQASVTASTGSSGSGTAHNNIQPSAIVLKIIKT